MPFSYEKLWIELVKRKMTKEQLRLMIKASPSTISKMGRDETVHMDVIDRICAGLQCEPQDIVEYLPRQERK